MSKLFKSLPETFIIFDTEFTAWKGSQERDWSGENEERELVQIGALKVKKLKTTIKVVKKLNIYIKPRINPILSDYFKNLTGIEQSTIDEKGRGFREAMKIFYRFCKNKNGEKFNLYSFGNDYHVIKENLKLNSINKKSKFYKWERKFFDITPFFEPYVNVKKYSSGTLYKAFNIKPKSKSSVHNALWDGISLFISLKHILI